jgi:hypothetical protein
MHMKFVKIAKLLVVVFLYMFVASDISFADVVATAKALAKYYNDNDWHYKLGGNAANKEIDCTQFIANVVAKELGDKVSDEDLQKIKNAININPPPDNLQSAVDSGDVVTKGVQNALVNVVNLGKVVTIDDVQEGDFIQYWYKVIDDRNATPPTWHWAGHSGIISKKKSTNPTRVYIIGAGSKTGIGETDFSEFGVDGLDISSPEKKVYVARLNP